MVSLDSVVLHLLVKELLVVFLPCSLMVTFVLHSVLKLVVFLYPHCILLFHLKLMILQCFLLVTQFVSVFVGGLGEVVCSLFTESIG